MSTTVSANENAIQAPVPNQPANRMGWSPGNRLKSWIGLPWQRRLGWAALQVPKIRTWEQKYELLPDGDLKMVGLKLRGRARGGESLDKLLPEAFGLVCVAVRRLLNMRPFDVQLAGGIVIHGGALAELATGEGKTLTAALPAFLNALQGKGVHVITVNDYLARRDAELLSPVYNLIGLTCGVIQQKMEEQDRHAAYRCDITYGTAAEFGFDFLRDRLKVSGSRGKDSPFWSPWMKGGSNNPTDTSVQRGHHYALVDEADNIFIDEARTPLIIATARRLATEEEQRIFLWADAMVRKMKPEVHFVFDNRKQKLELTSQGKQLMRYSNPPTGKKSHAMDKLAEAVEQGLHAHYRFRRDQHYMIDEKNQIVIIDEFTGRPMPDRHWQQGLHQAVEAKEGVAINQPSEHAAQITFQSFFRLYKKLSGMTGTAVQNQLEIRRVYGIWVVPIPTNRPNIRRDLPDRVFGTEDAKFQAVVEQVIRMKELGRAVLIGTRSVDKSMELSRRLDAIGISHQVLNAQPERAAREAEIVSHAGEVGMVTIATNMAGRGTDIKPDPEVITAGGMLVIGTERHESRRIDRQLIGRTGRQGNPGTSQFFLSLEDELLEGLGMARKESVKSMGQRNPNANWDRHLRLFNQAQKRIEHRHYISRVDLMVHQKQREEVLKDLGADPYVD